MARRKVENQNLSIIDSRDLKQLSKLYSSFRVMLRNVETRYVYFVFDWDKLYILSDLFSIRVQYKNFKNYPQMLVLDYNTYEYCCRNKVFKNVESVCIEPLESHQYYYSVYENIINQERISTFRFINYREEIQEFTKHINSYLSYDIETYNIQLDTVNNINKSLLPIYSNENKNLCYINKYIYDFFSDICLLYKINQFHNILIETGIFRSDVLLGSYVHLNCLMKKISIKDIIQQEISKYKHLNLIFNKDFIDKIFYKKPNTKISTLKKYLYNNLPNNYFQQIEYAYQYLQQNINNYSQNILWDYDDCINNEDTINIANEFFYNNCKEEFKKLFKSLDNISVNNLSNYYFLTNYYYV